MKPSTPSKIYPEEQIALSENNQNFDILSSLNEAYLKIQQDIPESYRETLTNILSNIELLKLKGKLINNKHLVDSISDFKNFIIKCAENKTRLLSNNDLQSFNAHLNNIESIICAINVEFSLTDLADEVQTILEKTDKEEKKITNLLEKGFNSILNKKHDDVEIKAFLKVMINASDFLSKRNIDIIARELNKVFLASLDFFIQFTDFVFNKNEITHRNITVFSNILKNANLHKTYKKLSLIQLLPLFKKYFENKTHIHAYEFSESLSIFIRMTFKTDDLIALFCAIDFSLSNANNHLRALHHSFMFGESFWVKMSDFQLSFIKALHESNKLYWMSSLSVMSKNGFKEVSSALSKYVFKKEHLALHSNNLSCFAGGKKTFDYFKLYNRTFLDALIKGAPQINEKRIPVFTRMLFYSTLHENLADQCAVLEDKRLNQQYQNAFLKLVNAIMKLHDFRLVNAEKEINEYVFKKLDNAAPNLANHTSLLALQKINNVIDDTLAISMDHLAVIIRQKNRIGKLRSGAQGINDVLKKVFVGENIDLWSTSSLADGFFYVHCYIQYSIDKFEEWTRLNNNEKINDLITKSFLDKVFLRMVLPERYALGLSLIEHCGYRFLQNNQVFTILAALMATTEKKHFFGKLGTGQGKSLIFALLALEYAKQGKKVAMFSCYEHLAKRDYDNFKNLFSTQRISAVYLDDDSVYEDAQIVYSDLSKFISKFYKSVYDQSKNSDSKIFNIFKFNVILLDEFDAILLDGNKIVNRVHNCESLFKFDVFKSPTEVKNNLILRLTISNPVFIGKLKNMGLFLLLQDWVADFGVEPGHEGRDYLGREKSYLGGVAYELSKGNFYLNVARIFFAPYILSAETIVGLSGSITVKGVKNFENYFYKNNDEKTANTDCKFCYIDIPSFFGLSNRKNRLETEEYEIKSVDKWLACIESDLKSCVFNKGRPVLIFGNIDDKENWTALEEKLKCFALRENRSLQILKDEEDLTSDNVANTGNPHYITLASHVAGRGVDFKIQSDINKLGGLHVIITYTPEYRLFQQMKGRTARMDNDGSHSAFSMDKKPEETLLNIDDFKFKQELNLLNYEILQDLVAHEYDPEIWKNWFIFLNIMMNQKNWPASLSSNNVSQRKLNILSLLFDNNKRKVREGHTSVMDKANDNRTLVEKQSCCTVM